MTTYTVSFIVREAALLDQTLEAASPASDPRFSNPQPRRSMVKGQRPIPEPTSSEESDDSNYRLVSSLPARWCSCPHFLGSAAIPVALWGRGVRWRDAVGGLAERHSGGWPLSSPGGAYPLRGWRDRICNRSHQAHRLGFVLIRRRDDSKANDDTHAISLPR